MSTPAPAEAGVLRFPPPAWLVHEDADLLAVHKPAGVTTHRSGPHALSICIVSPVE